MDLSHTFITDRYWRSDKFDKKFTIRVFEVSTTQGVDNALTRYQGEYYAVRTEKAQTKNERPVLDLRSDADGVYALDYSVASRDPSLVAGGSPKDNASPSGSV